MLSMISSCSVILCRPRGPLIRFFGLVAVALVSLFSVAYLTYCLPSSSSRTTRLPALPSLLATGGVRSSAPLRFVESPQRLVVFGDSWSDNGQYPTDPPPEDQVFPRDAQQGQIWTDWLCATMGCLHHDNFARPLMRSPPPSKSRGAVIDSSLLNSSWMAQKRVNHASIIQDIDITEPVSDLRAQIQQWLAFEKIQYGKDRSKGAEKQRTVFSVWFSNWELWYYSGGVHSNAQIAVTKSMDTLFEQLDLIAEDWTSDPKIILLDACDLTFLPSWRKLRTGPYGLDPLAEDQRNAVLLVEQWNLALNKRASRWNKGQIHVYNTNDWFLNQLRVDQIDKAKVRDTQGLGSPWRNVRVGCLGSNDSSSENNDNGLRCSDPNSYLFWDEFQFGPLAMKMLGESVAAQITSERSLEDHGQGHR